MELFGGRNNNVLIHTGKADRYETRGILEEALIHEAAQLAATIRARIPHRLAYLDARNFDMAPVR